MAEDSTTPAQTDEHAKTGDAPQDEGAKPHPEGDDALGEAGKKALSEERAARKAADVKAKELEAEVSRLRRSNAATKGTDLEAMKEEMRAEFAAQLVRAEVKAAAAGKLADPSDALRLLDLDGLRADDADGIKAALDQLLKDKPYLAAQADGPKPWGDVGGGNRKPAANEPTNPLERMKRAYENKPTD